MQQQGILDLSAYNIPKSDSFGVRIQENFSQYGVKYGQIVLIAVAIGGSKIFSQMRVLFTLFVSFVAWAYILKNCSVLDYIPDIGFIDSTDKKKIMLLLLNILVILSIAGLKILSYVGIGCLVVILHASLWKSASTLPGKETELEFEKILVDHEGKCVDQQ